MAQSKANTTPSAEYQAEFSSHFTISWDWKLYKASHVRRNWWTDPKAKGPWNTSWWSVLVGAISSQMIGTTKKAVNASITTNQTSLVTTRRLLGLRWARPAVGTGTPEVRTSALSVAAGAVTWAMCEALL